MSYDEKNAWAFGIIAILTYAGYLAVIIVRAQEVPLAEVAYAGPMIAAIGTAIVLGIIAGIVISVTSPAADRVRDERDRDINRRGEQTGQSFVVIGGIAVIVMAMLEVSYFWIANGMYLAFVLSAILATLTKLAGYRVGLPA